MFVPSKFVLFYQPPCGKWYVHSHKLYPTPDKAREAAEQFLSPGTPIAIVEMNLDVLEAFREVVS